MPLRRERTGQRRLPRRRRMETRASLAATAWYSILVATDTGSASRFDYQNRLGFARFVGTHAEYDAVDAASV